MRDLKRPNPKVWDFWNPSGFDQLLKWNLKELRCLTNNEGAWKNYTADYPLLGIAAGAFPLHTTRLGLDSELAECSFFNAYSSGFFGITATWLSHSSSLTFKGQLLLQKWVCTMNVISRETLISAKPFTSETELSPQIGKNLFDSEFRIKVHGYVSHERQHVNFRSIGILTSLVECSFTFVFKSIHCWPIDRPAVNNHYI